MQRRAKKNILKGLDLKQNHLPKVVGELSLDPFLRIYSEGEFVRSFRLRPGITVVGRDPHLDICIPDQAVSRKHLQIEYAEENRIYLQDLESQNGTELNGNEVTRARLESGDQIGLGEHALIISYPKPAVEPKIIPFPSVQTKPRIEVEKLAAPRPRPKVRVKRVAERNYLPALKVIGLAAVTVTAAAFLAWKAYDWNQARIQRAKEAPVVAPVVSKAKKILPTTRKHSRSPTSRVIPAPPSGKSSQGFSKSLRKSLRGLEKQDLRAADRLVASASSPTGAGSKTGRSMKGAQKHPITLEIKLPMSHEQSKRAKGKSRTLRTFNSAKYRKMLRSKVGSVEGCYAQHVASSGASGKISIWFSIAMSGQIKKSGIENSSFKSKGLQSCIVKQMLATKVDPPPWDGYTVTYTYRFGGKQNVTF